MPHDPASKPSPPGLSTRRLFMGFLKDWRRVFAAAALVFFVRAAGAGGVARDYIGHYRRLVAKRSWGRSRGVFEQRLRRVQASDFFRAEDLGGIVAEGAGHGSIVREVGYVGVGFVGDLEADALVGLKTAEVGHGAMEQVEGAGAGAIDGVLEGGAGIVLHGVVEIGGGGQAGFDQGAAADSPGSGDHQGGESFLGGALRIEVAAEGFAEARVFVFFAGPDVLVLSEEAGGDGVFGGSLLAFLGDRSGALERVGAAGDDLSWCCHGGVLSFSCFFRVSANFKCVSTKKPTVPRVSAARVGFLGYRIERWVKL